MRFANTSIRSIFIFGLAVGTLFPVNSANAHRFKVRYNFGPHGSGDGANPETGLVKDSHGNLYGTTFYGGAYGEGYGYGTVFKLASDGKETILHSFGDGKSDGVFPVTALAVGSDGNLYGTTSNGGGKGCGGIGCGVIFRIAPDGTETVLHSFSGNNDGANPYGGVTVDSAGTVYGTATHGGFASCGNGGCGTVFKIDANGLFTRLYSFQGWNQGDGAFPEGKLLVNGDGSLIGITSGGGRFESAGTVFKLSADGTETVVHYFGDGDDGTRPASLVAWTNGVMFGTTGSGGGSGSCSEGCGTIYKLTAEGTETVLYRFSGDDGSAPLAELAIDDKRNLYGTTVSGGPKGAGVLFKLARDGSFTALHSFCGNCKGGASPSVIGGLLLDHAGYLIGSATYGGENLTGLIYRVPK
jgi:uncharacterized repeat protein (TIGR03803 family)